MLSSTVISKRCISIIDSLNEWIGTSISWLTLLMVLTTFLIVVLRYIFDIGWIALQESVTYMHALVFMLGAAYTLKHDSHVRVDIFYQRCSIRTRAWIDCLGTLFLLFPVTGFILWSSWSYVTESWAIQENSRNAGGLPGLFLLKSSIIAMSVLLFIQGLSMFLKNMMIALGQTVQEN